MSKAINGVDTARLMETIEAIKTDPGIAGFQFRLQNRWIDGGENRSRIRDFFGAREEQHRSQTFELTNDEPPVLLSNDRAPNPVEYVLHALAGCLTTALVYHAAARGIPVRSVSTRFEGDLDLRGFLGMSDEVRRGYQAIRVVFDIDADADEATKRELMAIGQKYSPVFDIVTNGVPVRAELGSLNNKKAA